MHICINIFGQIRFIEHLKNTINTSLLDKTNTFHIVYTTWTNTDVSSIKSIFPDCYIQYYDLPDMNTYKYLTDSCKLDITQRKDKTISHYVLGFYIKKMSKDTILKYEAENNIKFDLIITMRTYTNLFNNAVQQYYTQFSENTIYSAADPSYNIYNSDAYPDSFTMAKRDPALHSLDVFDVLDKCTIGDNTFHPETSSYKIIINKGLKLIKLPFKAFIYE
jgi:hypothetical protein